ncbi:DUF4373 domain-containing protein [Pedobacter sp. Leaf132]|uniref:DUF4373 domain-containing protein n=1 Tax=Pedobacter sp. Leaf132 TaxID=2876557 RepID=UPI001E351C8E|nr:DUF4373 domain-containing protein [Pedobacter sp. Leaf132]
MARKEINNVDYFPFLCKEGKAMFYIEEKYGNDGYATWVKILRQLAVTNYHYLDLSDKVEFMFLASKCKVTEEILRNIIEDLVTLGEFDRELLEECNILFNQKFVDEIADAYRKRSNKVVDKASIIRQLAGKGRNVPPKLRNILTISDENSGELTENSAICTQRREEKKREEEIRGEKKGDFIPPERDDELEDSILKFFGFTVHTNFDKARTVNEFVFSLKNSGRLDFFRNQFDAYRDFKELSQGYIHSFQNFVGQQSQEFNDGAWNAENWSFRLNEEKEKSSAKKEKLNGGQQTTRGVEAGLAFAEVQRRQKV